MIQPKGLYFTRPSMGQYLGTKDEIKEGTDKLFEKIKLGKVKIEILTKYKLEDVVQAHKDLEARKIIGPAVYYSLMEKLQLFIQITRLNKSHRHFIVILALCMGD